MIPVAREVMGISTPRESKNSPVLESGINPKRFCPGAMHITWNW